MEVLAATIRAEKEIKEIQIQKEELKLMLFADNIELYEENPKDTIRKWLGQIYEHSKVAEYKIVSQKSLAFLYTNQEKSRREIEGKNQSLLQWKKIKYVGINLLEETKKL